MEVKLAFAQGANTMFFGGLIYLVPLEKFGALREQPMQPGAEGGR